MVAATRQIRDPEPRSGAEDGGGPIRGGGNLRADVAQIRGSEAVRGVGECGEVVDETRGPESEREQLAFADLPIAIREPDLAARNRARDREHDDIRHTLSIDAVEIVSQGLRETRIFIRHIRSIPQPRCRPIALEDGETRVRTADIADENAMARHDPRRIHATTRSAEPAAASRLSASS